MAIPLAKCFQVNWFSVNRLKIHVCFFFFFGKNSIEQELKLRGIFKKFSRLSVASQKQEIHSFVSIEN